MGIREVLNRNKPLTATVTLVAAALAIVFALLFFRQHNRPPEGSAALAWFTVDDGQTWFADDSSKIAPFEHDGRPAYRCYVFTCDGGKTSFVGFLERARPPSADPRSPTTAAAAANGEGPVSDIPPPPVTRGAAVAAGAREMEVKRPLSGDEGWVSDRSVEAVAIMTPRCPEGTGVEVVPQPVLPRR